jgi:hypothetical protein
MANRFWVGGAGTWNTTSTANWSASTGGASGASAPGVADAAIFDANSGAGAVVLGENVSCLTLNMSAFTGSLNYATYKVTLVGNAATIFTGGTGYSVSGTPLIEATYAGSTGTRIITMGATTEANAVSVNVTAGTDIITLSSGSAFKNLIFTGFAGSIGNVTGKVFYGNLTISSGMTLTAGTGVHTFAATSGTQQITTNGKTLDFPITQSGVGGTVQLQDNLTMGSTRTYTLTAGALDLSVGNRTLSTGLFVSNNANIRSIAFGTGNITLTGNSGRILDLRAVTDLTVTGTPVVNTTYSGSTGTRTIETGALPEAQTISVNVTAGTDIVTNTSTTARFKNLNFTGFAGTFNAGNAQSIYGNLTLGSGMTVGASTVTLAFVGSAATQTITTNGVSVDRPINFAGVGSTFSFQDALTQGSTRAFTITDGTVRLKNGVTSTVGSFVANNSSVKFLQSTTPGSQATLSQAAGTVNVVDLTIRDINAIGGASWNAYTDFENTDAGNNDGWNFSLSPPYSTAELPITLRPFTQPRRF